MEQEHSNSPVRIQLRTDNDGAQVLVLGSKEIEIGNDGTFGVNYEDVRNADLADLPLDVTLRLGDNLFDILVQRTDRNTARVKIGALVAHKVWNHNVGVQAYFEMLELSIKCHPRYSVSLWIYKIDTVDPYWTHFWFRSEFHESNIGNVLDQVSLLLSELLKEATGAEEFIEKTLERMRSVMQKKSQRAGPATDLDG